MMKEFTSPPTLVDLKAKAYDCLVAIDHWQRELKRVNEEIVRETAKSVVTTPTAPLTDQQKPQ